MAAVSTLPPLLSSDGHLEVRPERWTPAHAGAVSRARAAHDQAPGRRRRHFHRGSAALSRALPRPPGRPHERDVAAVRRDGGGHRRGGPARAAAARAGHRRAAGRGAVPEHAGRPASLAQHGRRRRLSRRGARVQRLARRRVLPRVARSADRARGDSVDEPVRCPGRARALRAARPQGRQPRRVSQRQVVSDAGGRHVLGRGDADEDAADGSRRLRSAGPPRLSADVRVPGRRPGSPQEARAAKAPRVDRAALPEHPALDQPGPAGHVGRLRSPARSEDLLRRDPARAGCRSGWRKPTTGTSATGTGRSGCSASSR